MRLIRAAGQNVSPSDDGRLYDQIFSDGLFTDTAFAALGTNNVQVGAMYGDLCGRDFTIEQQTLAVPLPEGDGETTGFIYVEIDTSAETPLSVGATLAPFTPTYEDINVNGAVAQMIVAEYTASAVAVTSVTATYTKAAAGSVKAGSIATVESSPVTANHAIGEYILYGGTVYRVTAAIATGEAIAPGTNVIAESVGDALTSLNNGLIVPLMSNTEFHAVNRTIAQGSYYECPVDGFYAWAVYGGNNATAMLFLDSDNNITKAFYASNTDNANHIVSFPFKAGTKVYTRSTFGNYVVKGYWAL